MLKVSRQARLLSECLTAYKLHVQDYNLWVFGRNKFPPSCEDGLCRVNYVAVGQNAGELVSIENQRTLISLRGTDDSAHTLGGTEHRLFFQVRLPATASPHWPAPVLARS